MNEMIELVKPEKVVLIDGSEEQAEQLRAEACASGEMIKLNQEKLPGCYLHRTALNDVARVEDRTFICSRKERGRRCHQQLDGSSGMLRQARPSSTDGAMKGRTMYVIPYSMGVVGSHFAKYGIELTDSIYVVLNMLIMTRVGNNVLDALGDDGDFIKGLHAKSRHGRRRTDTSFISPRITPSGPSTPATAETCFSVRSASLCVSPPTSAETKAGWQSICSSSALRYPDGEIKVRRRRIPVCLRQDQPGHAYSSRNTTARRATRSGLSAMISLGSDIGKDGRLWAVNPENGFFGVAPGTNEKSNPNALACTRKNTIFTNVALNTDDNTVWWEGLDKDSARSTASTGRANHGMIPTSARKDALIPNSRFTAPARTAPAFPRNLTARQAFRFLLSSSAADVQRPLRWFISPSTGSTAYLRRLHHGFRNHRCCRRCCRRCPPRPYGYASLLRLQHGRLLRQHWLDMGKKLATKPPKIFNVNWFSTR